MLQAVKVKGLDVCGSLVLSNPVTYIIVNVILVFYYCVCIAACIVSTIEDQQH